MGQCWHKARAEGSLEGAPGFAASSSNPAQPSEYFSARIQEMIERRGEYGTAVDSEIKESEVHWSELREMAESDKECSAEADKALFESLRQQTNRSGWDFFEYMSENGWELGKKIAEGAQGAIYEVKGRDGWIVKVFKAEAGSLEALHKQWPPGMLKAIQNAEFFPIFISFHSCALSGGVMLEDGRFGFMMKKYWGDLRKMIDGRMMHNGNQASPFAETRVLKFMFQIALGMSELHKKGIVHRDLKASNVLIQPTSRVNQPSSRDWFDPLNDSFECDVADFESSAMTVGTTFWRAPEILNALKTRSFELNVCTKNSDVYSYGMTCYEILSGKIPFEGVLPSNYDIVLGGERPKLPSDTCPWIQTMIESCWHHVPSKRPPFHEIVAQFEDITYYRLNCGNNIDYGEIIELLKFSKRTFRWSC